MRAESNFFTDHNIYNLVSYIYPIKRAIYFSNPQPRAIFLHLYMYHIPLEDQQRINSIIPTTAITTTTAINKLSPTNYTHGKR